MSSKSAVDRRSMVSSHNGHPSSSVSKLETASNIQCYNCDELQYEVSRLHSIILLLTTTNADLTRLLTQRGSSPMPTVPEQGGSKHPAEVVVPRKSQVTSSSTGPTGRESGGVSLPETVGHACRLCNKVTQSSYDTCRRCYRRKTSLRAISIKTGSGYPAPKVVKSLTVLPTRKRKLQEAVPANVQQRPPKGAAERRDSQPEALPVLIEPQPEAQKPQKIEPESGYDSDSSLDSSGSSLGRRSKTSAPLNPSAAAYVLPPHFLTDEDKTEYTFVAQKSDEYPLIQFSCVTCGLLTPQIRLNNNNMDRATLLESAFDNLHHNCDDIHGPVSSVDKQRVHDHVKEFFQQELLMMTSQNKGSENSPLAILAPN